MGEAEDLDTGEKRRILNDVAHAVSNIVPVYATDPDTGTPTLLSPVDLIYGTFLDGGHTFKTRRRELHDLTIRRRDMMSAIAFLKCGRIRFP
jgi:hypothetical protein